MANQEVSLTLLAAGRGTRYGGLKQLEPFGPHGELIMDYSIADAVLAGFTKVVLVVHRDNLSLFEEKLAKHAMRDQFQLEFAFQEQPLGTADAARSAAPVVNEPTAIINADDYYGGQDVYSQVYNFLANINREQTLPHYALLGYPLRDTISEFGSVSRGVCRVDSHNRLQYLEEIYEIKRDETGRIKGKTVSGDSVVLEEATLCSMAFWLLAPQFMVEVQQDYQDYLSKPRIEGRAGEFLLTSVIENQRLQNRAAVSVIPIAKSEWCGVTSPGDKDSVMAKLATYHEVGRYGRLRLD